MWNSNSPSRMFAMISGKICEPHERKYKFCPFLKLRVEGEEESHPPVAKISKMFGDLTPSSETINPHLCTARKVARRGLVQVPNDPQGRPSPQARPLIPGSVFQPPQSPTVQPGQIDHKDPKLAASPVAPCPVRTEVPSRQGNPSCNPLAKSA